MSNSTLHLGIFTCRKPATWDRRLYFPFERRRAEDFFGPEKSWRLRPGLNPRTWVLKGSTLPLDHRSRWVFTLYKLLKRRKFRLLPSDVLTNKVHPRPGILSARTCSNARRNARGLFKLIYYWNNAGCIFRPEGYRGFTAVRDKTFVKNLIYVSGEATHFQRMGKNAEQ